MTGQTLTLKGERYVIIREKVFRALTEKKPSAPRRKSRRLSAQDRGDIAEARRRKTEGPSLPYAELRKKLGLA